MSREVGALLVMLTLEAVAAVIILIGIMAAIWYRRAL